MICIRRKQAGRIAPPGLCGPGKGGQTPASNLNCNRPIGRRAITIRPDAYLAAQSNRLSPILQGRADQGRMAVALHTLRGQVDHREIQYGPRTRTLPRRDDQSPEDRPRGIRNLRTTLAPLHRALGVLFGEIELAVGSEDVPSSSNAAAPPVQPSSDARWENYKSQFPGVPARIIDALLIHGAMQVTHLPSLVKAAKATVYKAGDKLAAAGAITRNSGTWSLRK